MKDQGSREDSRVAAQRPLRYGHWDPGNPVSQEGGRRNADFQAAMIHTTHSCKYCLSRWESGVYPILPLRAAGQGPHRFHSHRKQNWERVLALFIDLPASCGGANGPE